MKLNLFCHNLNSPDKVKRMDIPLTSTLAVPFISAFAPHPGSGEISGELIVGILIGIFALGIYAGFLNR
jgi:hypothetical protein